MPTTFNNFQNILPDPNNSIADAGQATGSVKGPGFSSVSFTSEQKVLKDSTNSGRLLARAKAGHKWKMKISYNPMTRTDFEPVYNFLMHRRGALHPFFISLPQYRLPQEAAFAVYSATNKLEAQSSQLAGVTSLMIEKSGYSNTTNSTPVPGDLFNIDGANSNHKKAYMVNRVETSEYYQAGTTAPTSSQVRIHFTPGLSKAVSTGDDFVFNNPLIKVIMTGNIQEYSLNTSNLYSFSLNLEEVQ
jgi:hypothetical protein